MTVLPETGDAGRKAFGVLLVLLWAMPAAAAPADCPQPRFTQPAPAEFLVLENPVLPTSRNMTRARRLYEGSGRAVSCATCHGRRGDGMGVLASQFNPPPRNFACARTVTDIPDGQLFWIIRYGSPDTSMPAHPDYSDDDIWLLVRYLRRLVVQQISGEGAGRQ